jgi:hypothetical protein
VHRSLHVRRSAASAAIVESIATRNIIAVVRDFYKRQS